jgi:hypothetical protein
MTSFINSNNKNEKPKENLQHDNNVNNLFLIPIKFHQSTCLRSHVHLM